MNNFISIPITDAGGNYNVIVQTNNIITAIRHSSTVTHILTPAVGAQGSDDIINVTHAADTAQNSVATAIMMAVVSASSLFGQSGTVRAVDSPVDITSVDHA